MEMDDTFYEIFSKSFIKYFPKSFMKFSPNSYEIFSNPVESFLRGFRLE
jgi:hypothetical protein